MNPRHDLVILGWLLLLTGGFLLLPMVAATLFAEPITPYLAAQALAVVGGLALARLMRPGDRRIRPRDGFLVVGGAWLAISVVGAVPYVVAGALSPVDALFESVSGFTTTGSTAIVDTSAVDAALLLWRAETQWLGGMGIILFTIAILPLLGIGGMQLFRAEVPGPVDDKVRPRLTATARSLWGIYVGLTAAEWLLLRLAGVSSFEALCHSFTTLATGGFSTRNLSVGEMGSPLVEWIIVLFMLLAGVNFVLHYRLLAGRFHEVWRDSELRYYLAVALAGAVVLAVLVLPSAASAGEALRLGALQEVSILTTTGYVTADFERWPHLAHLVILVLMVLGGMSGSTGGGIKSLRALLALRSVRATLHRLIRPHVVRPVKYGGEAVPEPLLSEVWAFLTAYLVIAVVATGVVTACGYDVLTGMSAALTALGNVGPGLGEVGAYDNFAGLPALAKLVLSLCMLLGRLEIFTLLALVSRTFWRR